MFFVLSKTLVVMLTPVNFLIELGVLGVVLLLKGRVKLGRTLMVVSALLVAIELSTRPNPVPTGTVLCG